MHQKLDELLTQGVADGDARAELLKRLVQVAKDDSVGNPHKFIRTVRTLPAFKAEPTVPLHSNNVAIGSHVDDRAARGVREFSPFDYLTDIEVQHRLLRGWRMACTTIIQIPVGAWRYERRNKPDSPGSRRQERRPEAGVQADRG
jgi:hypothetical protein